MSFNNLSKDERITIVKNISEKLRNDLDNNSTENILCFFTSEDTYIRKAAYLALGRNCKEDNLFLDATIKLLDELIKNEVVLIRQSVIHTAREIGLFNFNKISHLLIYGINDTEYDVRSVVISCIKKLSEKNPGPTLLFAKENIHHPNCEIRREICHGIELRGRTHPEDVLPLLRELQYDKAPQVTETLIHVIGQISFNKDCLPKVINELKTWNNIGVVKKALIEILNVHENIEQYLAFSYEEAKEYIKARFQKSQKTIMS